MACLPLALHYTAAHSDKPKRACPLQSRRAGLSLSRVWHATRRQVAGKRPPEKQSAFGVAGFLAFCVWRGGIPGFLRLAWRISRLFAFGVAFSHLFAFGVPHEIEFSGIPPHESEFLRNRPRETGRGPDGTQRSGLSREPATPSERSRDRCRDRRDPERVRRPGLVIRPPDKCHERRGPEKAWRRTRIRSRAGRTSRLGTLRVNRCETGHGSRVQDPAGRQPR